MFQNEYDQTGWESVKIDESGDFVVTIRFAVPIDFEDGSVGRAADDAGPCAWMRAIYVGVAPTRR